MFDRSAIAKDAHRVARLYRGSVPYRQALSWGFAQAWRTAKAVAAIEARDALMAPADRARRDAAIIIHCNSDRLTATDYSRLTELSHAA